MLLKSGKLLTLINSSSLRAGLSRPCTPICLAERLSDWSIGAEALRSQDGVVRFSGNGDVRRV